MTDTPYKLDGFPPRRFPGWCVLMYAKPSRVMRGVAMGPWMEQGVFDRDRVTAEMRAADFVARGVG